MSTMNDMSTLNGFYKEVYGDNLNDLQPEQIKLAKLIKFVPPAKRTGLQYHQPVTLAAEHGVSYGGTEGEAFDYEPAISGATKDAVVKGAEMILRGRLSVGALSRSNVTDAASFGRASKHVIKNLLNSSFKKYENQCWYGGTGLATVASVAANVITITTAEWAPGIWVAGKGMRLSIYNGATLRGNCKITKVNITDRKITVDAMPAGVAGSDTIFEFGAKGKEFIGVHKMLTTTSGEIFGIETSDYSLWCGNQYACGSATLTFKKISKGVALSVAKGLEGKLSLFVNPSTWADLLDAQTSVRTFHEGGMSEYENGAESIKFYSQNGLIEIISCTYVKEGYAYGLDLSSFSRVGSSDITFKIPGLVEEQYMKHLENSNAVEFRTYSDSAIFADALGNHIVFTGIVNS